MSKIEYRDETQEKYTAMFKRCAFMGKDGKTYSRSNHWKMPVRVVVEADEVEEMRKAIEFFVGAVDDVEPLAGGLVKIESLGYFAHIGA